MKTTTSTWIAAALLMSCFSTTANAEGMRCKNDLVQIGDSKAEIMEKCGKPMMKDSFCKPAETTVIQDPDKQGTTVKVLPCENIDEWTYNPGPGQFYTRLQFERGTLKTIKYGSRVP